MSFLSSCNFCAMMIWPVSINLPSSFSRSGIGASRMLKKKKTDDFANHFRLRRIREGWVINHHLRLGRHIASSAVAVNSNFRYVFFWRRCRWRYCGNFHRCRCCRHSLISTRFQSWSGIPESVSTSKFHFVPRASTVSRRLHCSPGGFLRTDLHLSKPCFVPTRCSSDDAPRRQQHPLIHLFVSLAARTL